LVITNNHHLPQAKTFIQKFFAAFFCCISSTKKTVYAILFICATSASIAQPTWKVDIDGGVKDEDTKQALEGAKIEIFKGTSVIKTIYSNEKGKFSYLLEPSNSYTFKISCPTYIAKLISVSTENVPDNVEVTDNFLVKMQVSLYKEVPGIDFSVFDKPIGSIFYEKAERNFGFDVDYELSKKVEQLQKEYEKSLKDRLAKDKKDKEAAAKKIQDDLAAAKKTEIEGKKKLANDADAIVKDAKRKAELEEEEKRAAAKKTEKEEFEKNELERKAAIEEKQKKELKGREVQAEKKKEVALKKQAVVEAVKAKPEPIIIPVENIRTSESEGVNYHINHTFVVLNGEEIEYKKIVFSWGGVYHKRSGYDISDLTFRQELRMYGIETPK